MTAQTWTCPHCNTAFESPAVPRFCGSCGREIYQPPAVPPIVAVETAPPVSAPVPLMNAPAYAQTEPVTAPAGPASPAPLPEHPDAPAPSSSPDETGRHWGDLIAAVLVATAGGMIALVGSANDGPALAIGLAVLGVVGLGFVLSKGYSSYGRLSSATKHFVRLPAYFFSLLALVTFKALISLISHKTAGD